LSTQPLLVDRSEGESDHSATPVTQQLSSDDAFQSKNDWHTVIIIAFVILGLGLVVLVFFTVEPLQDNEYESSSGSVITSPSDTNEYRVINIDNGLTAMLISDSKTDSSAASIDYGAGSFFDFFEVEGKKEGVAGLAHFHEHMLFLGSKEYPGEDDFNNLLTKYSGKDNAFTAEEHTNFHFQCHNEGFRDVLKVWAAFFKNPLMTESSMYREMNQVHLEYTKDVPQDGWREWTMIKQTGKKGHPFQKFDIGSIETLNDTNIHTYLVDWHNKFFSAEIASLAIYSNETLDTLEKWVEDVFKDISSHPMEYPLVDGHPYSQGGLNKRYWVKPIDDVNSIDILWQIPVTYYKYRVPALEWIFSMIDFKGPGGLEDKLIQMDLATSVNSDETTVARTFGIILVSVKLTEHGLTQIEEIVSLVLQYIRLILEEGLNDDWRFKDYTDLDAFSWKYYTRPDDSLYSYVSDIASNMHIRQPADMLYPRFQCPPERYVWDKTIIRSVLESLTPESLNLLVFTKQHNYTICETEEYFKVKYQVETIPNTTIAKWAAATIPESFKLAPKNLWTIKNTDLYKDPNVTNPTVVYQNKQSNPEPGRRLLSNAPILFRGLYGYNTEKKVPKILVSFVFRNTFIRKTVRSFTIAKIFKKIAVYYMKLEFSQAIEVGYSVGFEVGSAGMEFQFEGYTDHMLTFITQFFELITSSKRMEVSDIIFGSLKDSLKKSILSDDQGSAYGQTRSMFFHVTMEQVYPLPDQAKELETITQQELTDFIDSIQGQVQVEYYVYGNGDIDLTKDIGASVDKLVETKEILHTVKHRQLPKGLTIIQERNKNQEDKNSASDLYIQITPDSSLENMVLLDMLLPLLKEKAFDQLRTKETLGYIVSAGGASYGYVLYARVIVVGPKHDSALFLERIVAFLQTFYDNFIVNMSNSDYGEHKASTIKKYTRTDLSLSEKFDKVYAQIESTKYDFEKREKMAKIAQDTKLKDLQDFYQKYFLSADRRLFSVQLFAHDRNQTLPQIPHRILASEESLADLHGTVFEHEIHMHGLH